MHDAPFDVKKQQLGQIIFSKTVKSDKDKWPKYNLYQ